MMLCDFDELKVFLGISDDSQDGMLSILARRCSAMIEDYVGYSFSRRTYRESHSVNNMQLLQLNHFPIQGVSFARIFGADVDFRLIPEYAETGLLYRGNGWSGNVYTRGMNYDVVSGEYDIEVEYTAGYYLPSDVGYVDGAPNSLPYVIQSACMEAVAESYNVRMAGAEGIKSHSEGGISTTFADSDSGGAGLSARVRGILESFRAVGVA